MAGRKRAAPSGFVNFDVLYESGTRTSNRRVPAAELGGLDGDQPALGFLETEDREIAEKSGRPRGAIKAVTRTKKRSQSA